MHPVSSTPPALRGTTNFARLAHALCKHKGDYMAVAHELADDPALARVVKAAVFAGTTNDASWAAETVDFMRLSGEFAAKLRPATIIGRLRGLRPVPSNTRTLVEIDGATAAWVGEGLASPVSAMALGDVTLGTSKMQATVVVTDELSRSADPAALAALEQLMIRALATALDQQFIDPTVAAGVGSNPASVTNAAAPLTSTGSSTTQATADLKAAVQKLIDAGSDLTAAQWILHPRTALALSLMLTAGGQFAFPLIGPLGGSLLGLPAITSAAVPIDTGNDTYITLIDAQRVLLADDGLAALDVSRQSSLQIVTDPSSGASSLVSLWASGLVGLRVARWIGWQVVDSAAIAVLEDVSY